MANQEITKSDIKKLAAEASEAGDAEQYALCVRALNGGDQEAWDACVRAISEARARSGE